MKNRFAKLRSNLTSLDNQPLSKVALIILIFLDIFILTSLFDGLEKHTQQLATPDDFIPYACREIVIDQDWNVANLILSYHNSYYPIDEQKKARHPICAPYLDQLDRMKRNQELVALLDDRSRFDREAKQLQGKIGNLKGAYDTSLLRHAAPAISRLWCTASTAGPAGRNNEKFFPLG